MSAFTLDQAAKHARSTRLECVHGGENTCYLRHSYVFFSTSKALPIHHLVDSAITTHSGKNSTSYGVALRTTAGESVALMRPVSRARADLVRSGVDSLVFHSAPGSAGMPIEESSPIPALLFGAMGIAILAMTLLFNRSAALAFDFDRGTVGLTKFRWPFRPIRETLEGAKLKRARVTARRGSKGSTIYSVVLVMTDNYELELVSGGGGGEGRNDAAAARINAAIGKMHDELNA
jgi:hypothetical protein